MNSAVQQDTLRNTALTCAVSASTALIFQRVITECRHARIITAWRLLYAHAGSAFDKSVCPRGVFFFRRLDGCVILAYNCSAEGVVGTDVRHINRLSKDWYALIDETHMMAFAVCVSFSLWISQQVQRCACYFILKDGRKNMGLIELLLLAVGLSMDAFAVSVCKGLAMPKISFKSCAICGVWFGGFSSFFPYCCCLCLASVAVRPLSLCVFVIKESSVSCRR